MRYYRGAKAYVMRLLKFFSVRFIEYVALRLSPFDNANDTQAWCLIRKEDGLQYSLLSAIS